MSDISESPRLGSVLTRICQFTPWLALGWVLLFWWLFFTSDLPNLSAYVSDRTVILLMLPEIYWDLLFAEADAPAKSGIGILRERLPVAGFALLIVFSALMSGRTILRRLKSLDELDAASAWGFAGGIGLSAVSLFTLSLGWFGGLSRAVFALALATPILLEAITMMSSQKTKVDAEAAKNSHQFGWKLPFASLLVVLPFVCVMLLGAMLPSTDFDVKEYHLQGPKEYFLAGQIQFLPHNVYTSFPFLTEMLSLFGMVISNDWWIGALVGKTVLFSFAPVTACGVFAVAYKIAGNLAGWASAICYLTTPWVFRISTIAYTEGALCCYVILTFLAFLHWKDSIHHLKHEPNRPRHWSLLVGLLAGSAVATKYPGLVLVTLPIAGAMIITLLITAERRRELIAQGLFFALGVIITFGPWTLKNAIETGNPVYPLACSLFGGADWDAELDAKWKNAHKRPTPVFKDPNAMLSDFWGNLRDVTFRNDWLSPFLFGFAPLALIFGSRRQEIWWLVAYATAILTAWYTLTHLLDRFWVPVIPVVASLAGIGFAALIEPRQLASSATTQLLQRLRLVAVAILIAGTLIYNFAFIAAKQGFTGNSAFLISYEDSKQSVKPETIQILEQILKPGDRVLFVGEAQVFDAEFDLVYNTVFDRSLLIPLVATENTSHSDERWDLLPPKQIQQNFKDAGITHVMINWKEILRYRPTYGYTDFVSPERIAELAKRWPFQEVQLNSSFNFRDWDLFNSAEQAEIDDWGPELKIIGSDGKVGVKKYQLFALPN